MQVSKKILAAIKAINKQNGSRAIPILNEILVVNGKGVVTDLDMQLEFQINVPDGLYTIAQLEGFDVKSEHDADDFPNRPDIGHVVWGYELPANELHDALKFVSPSISKEVTRYYLNGVCFKNNNIVATNGHTLHKIDVSYNFGDGLNQILPSGAVKVLIGLLKGIDGDVSFFYGDNKFQIKCDEFTLTCKSIDGTFPDYNRVIPKYDTSFNFTSDTYMQLNKKLVKHPEYKSNKTVVFEGNVASYCGMNFAIADTYPIEIGFNVKYLAELGINGEMTLRGDRDPMKIVDGNKTVVIMPMRI